MLEKLRKINIKTAVYMAIGFYALVILLHILIISGALPFTWVNGGRSESFATQLPISIINIIIAVIGAAFTLIVSRNKLYKYKKQISFVFWFFVALWFVGFMQQLLGTPFEKMVLSLLLLLGVVSNLRMAIEKR